MASWHNVQKQPLLEAGPLTRHPAAARRGCGEALGDHGPPRAGAEGRAVAWSRAVARSRAVAWRGPCVTPPPPRPHFLPRSLLPVLVLGSAPGGFCCSLSLGDRRAPPSPCFAPTEPAGSSRCPLSSPPHSVSALLRKRSELFMDQENTQIPAARFPRAMLGVSALSSFILLSVVLLPWP